MGELSGAGFSEHAVVFGRAGHLVGVLSTPTRRTAAESPAVVFVNSGILHRVGGNRLYVRLARALARAGATVLRFDLSGLGDSAPAPDQATLSRVDVEQRDIDDALQWLQERGAVRLIVGGLCSGSDNSLLAISRNPRVSGAVLLDGHAFRTKRYYLAYYGPRLLKPSVWWRQLTGQSPLLRELLRALWSKITPAKAAPGVASVDLSASKAPSQLAFEDRLRALLARDARLLWVFTGGIEERYIYREQFFDAFPRLNLRTAVDFEYIGDADHTFSREVFQGLLEDRVVAWFRAHFGNARPGSPGVDDLVGFATSPADR